MDLSRFKKLFIGGIELKQLFIERGYTNLADQTSADWWKGKRINSSGVLTDSPGWDMTNFIPISADTKKIHIKGLDILNAYDGTNYGRVYAYNDNETYVDYKQPSTLPSYFYVSDYDAGVWIFDVEAARSNVNMNTVVTSTYLRFGGKPISDKIVITINQDMAMHQVWKGSSYTNQVPISTDTDGSIFNGTGYKENVRLSSSGGISGSAQNGSVTTGFIHFYGDSTVIRLKGVEFITALDSGKHYYYVFYDANKKSRSGNNDYFSSGQIAEGALSHILTATRDENGVETISFNREYGTSNSLLQWIRSASYVRITAKGKGADMIVTINEEIT